MMFPCSDLEKVYIIRGTRTIKGKDNIIAIYTVNSIKVVLSKALTATYKRARDHGLLLIFTSKHGIISLKQHRGLIGNLHANLRATN